MRTAVAMACIGLLVGCAPRPMGVVATTPPASPPLKLPVVLPGQCPTSAVTLLDGVAPRVGTPMQFGFGERDGSPWPSGAFAFNKTLWDTSGPPSVPAALLRGGRLDGEGKLFFGGSGINEAGAAAITVTDPQGGTMSFYGQLHVPGGSQGTMYTYPTMKGCFGIQADFDGAVEIVIIKAI
jgi:hypothetical protein